MKTLLLIVLLSFSFCEKNSESIDFESLPLEWVNLTEQKGEWIIFNSCDAGNLLLSIIKTNSTSKLLLHGQQEDTEFEIIKYSTNKDTLLLETYCKEVNKNQQFKFYWYDKIIGIGLWSSIYSNIFHLNQLVL